MIIRRLFSSKEQKFRRYKSDVRLGEKMDQLSSDLGKTYEESTINLQKLGRKLQKTSTDRLVKKQLVKPKVINTGFRNFLRLW